MKTKKLVLSLWIFLILPSVVYSNIPTHSGMEKNFKETWRKSFPVPYAKILKRDLTGKGVLVYKKTPLKIVYIYTYLIFLPLYKENEELPQEIPGKGKEVRVKLFYEPSNPVEKFWIEFTEFDEQYNSKSVVRWIR
ncbi:hypothetical protein ACO2J1_09570 [Leptospira interrogans]|uniref:Uncharacterized protein n=17 Tax=Leptospira interrogans TaxID=173 RepID=Q8EXF0_LEPIN|nr:MULTISPECIES: hypothetical protein [Leptospira]APH43381.1 Uncharacterized protein A9P81_3949 [Leptospira interrogans serovar Copenhageni/Icterohaemorrhagiae]EMF40874.1 hypothetical protein LEP1GSC067_2224 [Leptospira interrogans serovar Lora str. TE 1992]EMM79077.1 hypothetical protein LEP1GSC037_3581 [Leptospira interrogans str. 2006001854]EMM94237.1 hypothetical protein LEP1GSC158_0059 [Leptospira interrogans serovar Zanoni str. LT2156]EMN28765.1 hypothetical protein LEP1GSC083_3068 [Lept